MERGFSNAGQQLVHVNFARAYGKRASNHAQREKTYFLEAAW